MNSSANPRYEFCSRPHGFSWEKVIHLSPVERLDHAFAFAKDQLNIERLLDPEGNEHLTINFSLFGRCSQVKFSHLNRYPCNQKFHIRAKDIPTKISQSWSRRFAAFLLLHCYTYLHWTICTIWEKKNIIFFYFSDKNNNCVL